MKENKRRTASHAETRTTGVPASWPDDAYILFCRCEDDEGDGFHVFMGAANPEEGDALARDMQPIVKPGMSLRCELVANDAEAIEAWASHSVKRKKLLSQHGENQR